MNLSLNLEIGLNNINNNGVHLPSQPLCYLSLLITLRQTYSNKLSLLQREMPCTKNVKPQASKMFQGGQKKRQIIMRILLPASKLLEIQEHHTSSLSYYELFRMFVCTNLCHYQNGGILSHYWLILYESYT